LTKKPIYYSSPIIDLPLRGVKLLPAFSKIPGSRPCEGKQTGQKPASPANRPT